MNYFPASIPDSELERRRGLAAGLGATARLLLAATPFGSLPLQIGAEYQARAFDLLLRRIELLATTLEALGFAVADLQDVLADEKGAEVVERALKGAVESPTGDKLLLLAGVISGSVTTPPDHAHLMLSLVERMEAVHVQVLHQLARARPGSVSGMAAQVIGHWGEGELCHALPEHAPYIGLATSWLEANGLITDVSSADYAGRRSNPAWSLTGVGEGLMEFVLGAADR